jgi:putative Mn2+ efflux pump MntP
MGVLELIVLGFGLSLDASTAAMADGICEGKINFKKALFIAATFAIFQGIMPIFGFYGGRLFRDFISNIAHYLAFIILLILGIRMILDSRKLSDCEQCVTYPKIILQGFATSIDALMAGLAFAFLQVKIYLAFTIITVITFIACLVFIYIGQKFGSLLKNKSLFFGGLILIVVGFKILLSGL